jgi:hypothetical protein
LLAGVLITIVSGVVAAVLLYRWCVRWFSPPVARIAVTFFLLYPYSYYIYGVVYADALYVALVLAAFVALDEGHPIIAGLAGAGATAVRPVGVFLVAGLCLRTLQLRGWKLPKVERRDAGVLLAGGGLAAYLLFLWWRFGKPTAFASAAGASGWSEGQRARDIWLKIGFFRQFSKPAFDAGHFTTGLQALLVVVSLALAVLVIRRLGWAYGGYSALTVAVPTFFSQNFIGTGRYILAAFPCFAVGAELLTHRPRLRWVLVASSAATLVLLTSFWARYYYLS